MIGILKSSKFVIYKIVFLMLFGWRIALGGATVRARATGFVKAFAQFRRVSDRIVAEVC